jgi:hypothetical protein
LDRINRAAHAKSEGVATSTIQKQIGNWHKWEKFVKRAGYKDVFLGQLDRPVKNWIVASFAIAIRNNEYGKTTKRQLRGDTVSTAINDVGATFRENGYVEPQQEIGGKQSIIIKRIIESFRKSDPPPIQQYALPLSVFRRINTDTETKLDSAISQLIIGALFFGMRSCEYLKIDENEVNDRLTKVLRLRNLVFRYKGQIRSPVATNQLDSISITFENQKNGEKMETVTQLASEGDICPVKAWREIYTRIWSYKNSNINTPVYAFEYNSKLYAIQSEKVRTKLRDTVMQMHPRRLGITNINQVGTRSIRVSFAMLLHLNRVKDTIIMQLGRWKSDACLKYIRKQVSSYGTGISTTMLGTSGNDFFMIPHSIENNNKQNIKGKKNK